METGPPQGEREEREPYELPSRQRARTMVRLMIIVVLALLIASVGKPAWNRHRDRRAMKALQDELGLDQANVERMLRIAGPRSSSPDDPDFRPYLERLAAEQRARGETVDAVALERSLIATATQRGVPRLADQDLLEWHALRKRLVFASERICPCALDGSACTPADTFDGLARLTDQELDSWTRLSSRAALLEVRATAPLAKAAEDYQAGLDRIVRGLDPPSSERLIRTLDQLSEATPADRCFSIRALLTGAEALEEEAYLRFVRAFMALSAP